MFHPSYPSPTFIPWRQLSPDPAPSSPVPLYFGHPSYVRVAWVEDDVPCPPSPQCVEDALVWQNASTSRYSSPSAQTVTTENVIDSPDVRFAWVEDDNTPCPPSPQWVESEDRSSGSTLATYQSNPEPHYYSPSPHSLVENVIDLDSWTEYDDSAADSHATSFNCQHDDPVACSEIRHASDCLVYSRDEYAFPSPILVMIRRAIMDRNHLHTQPVIPSDFDEPLKLFSLTGGHIPLTGLTGVDIDSRRYYSKRPNQHLRSLVECHYPVSAIDQAQGSLLTEWSLVYPMPIPIMIIRSGDIVWPYDLRRRADGCAFIVPAEDSIWDTICLRGVDMDYRPLDPSATVETSLCGRGEASYHAHHVVASKFAVNVFLELPDLGAGLSPRCEYMGAYVIRVMDGLTVNRATWMDLDPAIQQSVYNRVPGCFTLHDHPSLGWPQLPYVQFCFYKWDENMVGLADEIYVGQAPARLLSAMAIAGVENCEPGDSSDSDTDSGSDSSCNCDDCKDTMRELPLFPSAWPLYHSVLTSPSL